MQRMAENLAGLTRRILPDPMVIACGLTLFVLVAAVALPQVAELQDQTWSARIPAVAAIWLGGVWDAGFLKFALQMCVVLLTGYGLAKAPAATRFLHFLAGQVGSNRSAVFIVAAVSCVGCWINWGLGLIASGVLAARLRAELRGKGVRCQYALIVAGAYAGMMIWHGGLSGSAPLRVAKEGVRVAQSTTDGSAEVTSVVIGIRRTTLSNANLVLSAILIIFVPVLLRRMASDDPPAERESSEDGVADLRSADAVDSGHTIADRINHSRITTILLGAVAVVALVGQVGRDGSGAVNLDFVNTLFLALGLLLHRSPIEYVRAVAEGGRAVTGIVIQFPLYSGIQGVMTHAGIAAGLSHWFVDLSQWTVGATPVGHEAALSVATFFSAGIVNLFVPSGGGQWIVQGPIMCDAAQSLSVPIERVVMALSYGDQWSNMIQPFWAIPLMGLTGVSVRRFMGYCVLLMVIAMPVFIAAILLS